jgi:hypothetical protein
MRCSDFPRSSSGFEPGLCRQRAPPPGNGISRPRDKSAETASQIQLLLCRDQAPAACAANSGPFATRREISLNSGMRGGVRSHLRTRLLGRFAFTAKIQGKRRNCGQFWRSQAASCSEFSGISELIPCSAKTGNSSSVEQGIRVQKTGDPASRQALRRSNNMSATASSNDYNVAER